MKAKDKRKPSGYTRFAVLISIMLMLGLMQGMSLTALADNSRQLSLSLSGAQYGSYKVSVNGVEKTTLSTDDSTQIAVYTNDVITVTFSPKENGQVEKFYLDNSTAPYEEDHKQDIGNNSYTFNLSEKTKGIFVRFGYKNQVETVNYVDELGLTHSVAATVLTGAETVNYYSTSSGFYYYVSLGDNSVSQPTWYVVKGTVSYARNDGFNLNLELYGDVHIIVADGVTLSVQGEIRGGSYRPVQPVSDTLSIYGQAKQTGTVSAGKVTCENLNLYSSKLTVGSVNNNTVNIKGGTLAVSGNVDAQNLDISGGTTTISGKAYMVNLTLGCHSVKDSITISAFERTGYGTTKYADGQQLTDGIDVYSGPIYDSTWPNGKTLRKVDTRDVQTITAADMTVTYGDTDKSVSGTTDGDGTISYAVKDGSTDYIDVNANTGALTIKKVPADGKAYVTIKAEGTEDYKETTRDITVTINKAVPTVTAPAAKTLTYTGSAQALVDAGTATGGEMQYALGDANGATGPYTTSIPTATDAGTYYVWYYVKGDSNHTDSEPVCIMVKIAGAAYTVTDGEHTINDGKDTSVTVKREPDDSKTYDLYTGAQVDGKDLPEGSHTTAKGSLILTLKSSYLDTLSVGEHKLKIAFKDGSTDAKLIIKPSAPAPTPTPKPVPRTGDSNNIALWLGLAVAGLILIAGTVIMWNRKKRCGK